MASSLKELWLAYFKGIACAKGEIAAENEGENGLAEDRWITIHPWGMSQGEADTGEGKGYYRRIFIDDETGEIEKGLGAGTNIKDLSKTLKAKKNGEESEKTSKTDNSNLSDLAKKIKALTDGKEYTEEVANKVGDLMRQELEKNKDYSDLVDKLDLMDKLNKELESFNLVDIYQPLKDAQNKLREYVDGVHDRLWTHGGSWDSKKDPEYQKLSEDYDKAYMGAYEERYRRLSSHNALR